MRTLRNAILGCLVAAGVGGCILDVPAITTTNTTIDDESTGAPPEPTTTSGEPTGSDSSTGDSSTGDSSTGDSSTGGEATSTGEDATSTGEPPPADCPAILPAPANCGPVPEVCGGATPVAGGGDTYLWSAALSADSAWFLASASGCLGLYRAPKAGGEAHRVRPGDHVAALEADDEAVYVVEYTGVTDAMRVVAWSDGVETVLGEHAGNGQGGSFMISLARTRTGVVAAETTGDKHPTFFALTPGAMTEIGVGVGDAYLASAPAYDGERLFFTWSDVIMFDEFGPLHRRIVGLAGGVQQVLGENASTRGGASVAVDDEAIYFATGDPMKIDGVQALPMTIVRQAKTGGPATPLFAEADIFVEQVLVDDAEVFWVQAPHDIFAVPRTGGAPRHVFHGALASRVSQDADHLYFAVSELQGDLPLPGRDFVVRVAKATEIP